MTDRQQEIVEALREWRYEWYSTAMGMGAVASIPAEMAQDLAAHLTDALDLGGEPVQSGDVAEMYADLLFRLNRIEARLRTPTAAERGEGEEAPCDNFVDGGSAHCHRCGFHKDAHPYPPTSEGGEER